MSKLFLNTLPKNTTELVGVIQSTKPSFLNDFYLSGGTSLALQIGHRQSDDLDFFNQHSFNPMQIETKLKKRWLK